MGRKAIDPNDIIGKRFGKLVVKEYQGRPDYKYLCQCDCGKETSIYRYDLLRGNTKSCGCGRGKASHFKECNTGLSKYVNPPFKKEIHKLVGRQIGPYYVAQGAGLSSIDKKSVLYLCLDQNGNEVILREERLLAV